MVEKLLLDKLLSRLKSGGLTVTFWDGTTKNYGLEATPKLGIKINDPAVVRAIGKNVSLGVGESYMDGSMEITGPLEDLIEFGYRNQEAFDIAGGNKLYKKLARNIKANQPKLISYHYDLGNDFYELWLDKETLGYTCGYYKKPTDSLEVSQIQKFDHVLNKLQLDKNKTLLDIGFGWGYLLVRAAERFGVKGTGVSLSKEQLKFAQQLAKKHGVEKLIDFKLMNYQDLPDLKTQFDRVVSVGFFEHVGQGNQRTYFDVVNKVLKDGGVSVLHCISQPLEAPMDPWMDKYIFPGTYLPSIREVTALLPEYNFQLKDYENIGPHYIPTLYGWWERFEKHKDEIIKMYDERFYRMWRFYLAASIASFRQGDINLSQWVFSKGTRNDWPLTREFLYK
ncbi:MAG TPA: cyclopropane-fatty-acyl-phospholipid synthase family protein [Candidatus Saccharimonadia bacterium]|nr:cyclopropane-fatty-acyl-phospholipid synthase family protein [Candidatus Saccharimonadia bacterium]